MNILISIDNNYVDHAINMIESLRINNLDKLRIFLIHDDLLSKESINILKEYISSNNIGNLNTILFNNESFSFPKTIDYISINTYYRLFAPYLLPKYVDKVLYLDCDIVCTGSIEELYNSDLEDNIFVACKNMLPEHLIPWGRRNNLRLGLSEDYTYVNAGVLLIDTNKYKNQIAKEEIYDFIRNNKNLLMFQDQDVINKLFFNKIKTIIK